MLAQNWEAYTAREIDSLVDLTAFLDDPEALGNYLKTSLASAKEQNSDVLKGLALRRLGQYHTGMDELEEAADYLQEAATLYQAYPTAYHRDQGLVCMYQGYLKEIEGDYKAAETYYLKTLKSWKGVATITAIDRVEPTNFLALLYLQMGAYEQAEPLALEVRDVWKAAAGDLSVEYGVALNNLATVYYYMDNLEAADALYRELVVIDKTMMGANHTDYATTLGNLASVCHSMGRYEEAEALYLESKDIRKAQEELVDYGESLNNLSVLYSDLGEYKKAEALVLEALELEEKHVGKQPTYAMYLLNLGMLYTTNLDQYQAGETALLEAARIFKHYLGEAHPDYAAALVGLGDLYGMQGDLDRALSYIVASLRANSNNFEAVYNFPTAPILDSITGTVALQLNDFRLETIKLLADLDYISPEDTHGSLSSLFSILKYQSKQGQESAELLALEYQLAETALKINEQFRRSFTATDSNLRLLRKNEHFIGVALNAASKLIQKKQSATKNYYHAAFHFAEQNKSMLLADALKNDRAANLGDLPAVLVEEEQYLQAQQADLKKQRLETNDPDLLDSLAIEESKLVVKIDEFLRQIKGKYPKYHAFKYENITATAEEIQGLLAKDQLLLEYLVLDSVIYLFTLSAERITLDSMPISRAVLHEHVASLRKGLSDYSFILHQTQKAYETYTLEAYWFYEQLLAPSLNRQKGIQELVVIADGELGFLPFEAFLTKEAVQGESYTDLAYLVRAYQISYNYSATLFQTLSQLESSVDNQGLLAIAPTYQKDALSHSADRPLYLMNARTQLKALPQAVEEVKTIAEWWPDSDIWLDSAANEGQFKAVAGNYAILHLAMHGWLNTRTPILSSLVFSENGAVGEDNFLQADEISKLQLNADLVVLSACETGYGKFERGEGVLSLARSFMYAGVPSLVVSLWQVNDGSTAIIMKSFYQYLAQGMDKAAALRQAKLDYLDGATTIIAHPAFWSPFIQLGNDAPVNTSNNRTIWIVGVSVLLLLIFGWIIKSRTKKRKKEH